MKLSIYCAVSIRSSFFPKVLSVTLKGVVRIFGSDSAVEGIFKRRRKETEEIVNIEEKRSI